MAPELKKETFIRGLLGLLRGYFWVFMVRNNFFQFYIEDDRFVTISIQNRE
jgi:hypothetical protein